MIQSSCQFTKVNDISKSGDSTKCFIVAVHILQGMQLFIEIAISILWDWYPSTLFNGCSDACTSVLFPYQWQWAFLDRYDMFFDLPWHLNDSTTVMKPAAFLAVTTWNQDHAKLLVQEYNLVSISSTISLPNNRNQGCHRFFNYCFANGVQQVPGAVMLSAILWKKMLG